MDQESPGGGVEVVGFAAVGRAGLVADDVGGDLGVTAAAEEVEHAGVGCGAGDRGAVADALEFGPVVFAVRGAEGVLTVLVPFGTAGLATRTAEAVLAHADPGARLVFSCGWHVAYDGNDRYALKDRILTGALGLVARLSGQADPGDQVRAAARVFASDKAWTVVRASDLEEGASEGLPAWSAHVGDPLLASNRTRRTDFALFMLHALTDDRLLRKAPAIVSRASASARAHRLAALSA